MPRSLLTSLLAAAAARAPRHGVRRRHARRPRPRRPADHRARRNDRLGQRQVRPPEAHAAHRRRHDLRRQGRAGVAQLPLDRPRPQPLEHARADVPALRHEQVRASRSPTTSPAAARRSPSSRARAARSTPAPSQWRTGSPTACSARARRRTASARGLYVKTDGTRARAPAAPEGRREVRHHGRSTSVDLRGDARRRGRRRHLRVLVLADDRRARTCARSSPPPRRARATRARAAWRSRARRRGWTLTERHRTPAIRTRRSSSASRGDCLQRERLVSPPDAESSSPPTSPSTAPTLYLLVPGHRDRRRTRSRPDPDADLRRSPAYSRLPRLCSDAASRRPSPCAGRSVAVTWRQ